MRSTRPALLPLIAALSLPALAAMGPLQAADAPEILRRPALPPQAGAPGDAARSALAALGERIPQGLEGLTIRRVIPIGRPGPSGYGPMGATVRFTQRIHGIPAEGDRAIVSLGPDGAVISITLDLLEIPPRPEVRLRESDALRIARAHHPIVGDVGADLRWEGAGDAPRLSWRIHHREPGGRAFVSAVDAQTGAFRGRLEVGAEAGPEALAYLFNPFLEDAPADITLPDLTEGALTTPRLDYWMCKDLQQTTPYEADDGQTYQSHICSYRRPDAPEGGDYRFTPVPYPEDPARDEDAFVGPNLVYTLDAGLNFLGSLGVPSLLGEPFWVLGNVRWPNAREAALLTDTTAPLATLDNAYFSPPYTTGDGDLVPGTLSFGQGSISDFGYDADVALHELSHALVHTLDGPRYSGLDDVGLSFEPSALNEGFADYFSMAMQGDPYVGEYAGLAWEPEGLGVRDLQAFVTCPGDLINQQHNDSQIFSGALWDVRSGLDPEGQGALDLVVLSALSALSARATISMGAQGVLDAAQALVGADLAHPLEDGFRARGAIGCQRVRTVTPAGLEETLLSYTPMNGGASFGTEDPVPAGIQLLLNLDDKPRRKRVRVRFVQAQYKGVPLRAYGYNRAPRDIVVLGKEGASPITHEALYGDEGTTLSHDGEVVATATLREDLDPLEGTSYVYPYYEAEFELKKTSGPYTLQLANASQDTAYVYEIAVEVGETEGCGGCDSRPGAPVGLGWLLFGLVAVVGRRRS